MRGLPLPDMFIKGRLLLLATVLLLAGCAATKPDAEPPKQLLPEDPYARIDLDGLLEFGADFAAKPANERAEVCKTLASRNKQAPQASVQLRLLSGRMLSDACGDIPKILGGVETIPAESLPDEPARRWVSWQKEALRRVQGLSKKLALLERKQKALQSMAASKGPKPSGKGEAGKAAQESNAQMLRQKLEALRDIEQQMDDTGKGSQP